MKKIRIFCHYKIRFKILKIALEKIRNTQRVKHTMCVRMEDYNMRKQKSHNVCENFIKCAFCLIFSLNLY